MGRKIPGRKHRGIKDPEKQAAERLNSIRDKINAPPSDPEIQEVSKTLQRLIDLKNKTKSGEFDIKKKKKLKVAKKSKDPDIKAPKANAKEKRDPIFQQLPNENEKQFLYRINKVCENVTKEAAFEEKYGVEIKRDEGSGEVKVVKRPKDELEVLLKKVKKKKTEKKVKKKKSDENVKEPKLTKSQKWEKKKKEKKLKKKKENPDEFTSLRDPIGFGEVAHAPPTLPVPKKVEKIKPKPVQKKLLLSAILQSSKQPKVEAPKQIEKLSKVSNKTIDRKGKRKGLPNAVRRQLDKQQKEVIGAYKLLKAKKLKDAS